METTSRMETEIVRSRAELWWDWSKPTPREFPPDDISDLEKRNYLDDLVNRCILIDSLSPEVTAPVLVAAFEQFGTVYGVKFLKSPLTCKQRSGLAIVEMENPVEAVVVEAQLRDFLFMVGGLPRPVRGLLAEAPMFIDHPFNHRKPVGDVRIVTKDDIDAGITFKRHETSKFHALEASFLYEAQRKAEEDLAKKQESNYLDLKKKYVAITENKELADLRIAYRQADEFPR